MKQKWKKCQVVEISLDEIFCFQDKLDNVKDDLEEVWCVVDDFFMECENQLELDPNFLKELKQLDLENDFDSLDISLSDIEDLWKLDCKEDYNPSHIDVLKEYIDYKK